MTEGAAEHSRILETGIDSEERSKLDGTSGWWKYEESRSSDPPASTVM